MIEKEFEDPEDKDFEKTMKWIVIGGSIYIIFLIVMTFLEVIR